MGTFRRNNRGFVPTFTQATALPAYAQPFQVLESRGRQGNRPCPSANSLSFPEMA